MYVCMYVCMYIAQMASTCVQLNMSHDPARGIPVMPAGFQDWATKAS